MNVKKIIVYIDFSISNLIILNLDLIWSKCFLVKYHFRLNRRKNTLYLKHQKEGRIRGKHLFMASQWGRS